MEIRIDKDMETADVVMKTGVNVASEACVFFGEGYFCKTEAEAREAAELLKAFFEAKAAGHTTTLLVSNPKRFDEKPAYCSDGGYACGIEACKCTTGCRYAEGLTVTKMDTETGKEFLGRIPGIIGGVIDTQRPKNTVIDQMNDDERDHHAESANKQFDNFEAGLIADRIWGNRANDMTLEQYEVFTIAHNAALIYAHNMHFTDERRAVQSAAKIMKHAQESE